MDDIAKEYFEWKSDKSDEFIYDEIFDYVDSKLTRGDMCQVMDFYLQEQLRLDTECPL